MGRVAVVTESSSCVPQAAQETMKRVNVLSVLDTLFFLAKGGRIPKAATCAGSLSRIKPILDATDDVRLFGRRRTRKRAAGAIDRDYRGAARLKAGVRESDARRRFGGSVAAVLIAYPESQGSSMMLSLRRPASPQTVETAGRWVQARWGPLQAGSALFIGDGKRIQGGVLSGFS